VVTSPVPPCGQLQKLYHPWTGPFRVLKKLSEETYIEFNLCKEKELGRLYILII